MYAKDFMSKDVITCLESDIVKDVALSMWNNKFSAIPVVTKENKLVGIVTQSDFIGKDVEIPHALGSIKGLLGELYLSQGNIEDIYSRAQLKKVQDVMTKHPKFLTPETSLNEVVNLMERKHLKRIPVVEDGEVVGIVTRKDLIKAFLNLNIS